MTDKEIIQGLIDRDNLITHQFFYINCRPLLMAIMRVVVRHPVSYEEMVSTLYDYLMEDDSRRLRQFQYRSSLYQWLKIVATRFFIRERESHAQESAIETCDNERAKEESIDSANIIMQRIDIDRLFEIMENKRYVEVLRHLILQDEDPQKYARSIGVTVDNLYNIKRRAMASLTRIALRYYHDGR